MITVKLCLSKIDKTKIFTSETTGEKYLDIVLSERKEADQYGNTHSVAYRKNKGEATVYLEKSSAKEVKFNTTAAATTPPEHLAVTPEATDDLPF